MNSALEVARNIATEIAAALAAGETTRVAYLRDCWCAVSYADLTDRELADWMFRVDAAIIEHDAYCCCDDERAACVGRERRLLASLSHEADRRVRYGITVSSPDEETFEQRHAPYGTEWELEQRERMAA